MLKFFLLTNLCLGLWLPSISSSNRRKIPASCLKAMFKAALDRTNMYRVRHHAKKLTEDATIGKTAQVWADYLSDNGAFKHNKDKLKKLGYGENIAWTGSSAIMSTSDSACAGYASKMIDAFYNEVKKASYNYVTGKSRNGGMIGHFTQLVWNESSKVGHGFTFSARPINGFYRVYLVANYKSPGNVNCPSGCVKHVKPP